MLNNSLDSKIKILPNNAGVYVMLDRDGHVIYVGKAKNLKNRVKQYFYLSVKTEKVLAMVSNIADFYYIITKNEYDALALENNLIKKHKPKYNILLKDDKTFPYLKVNLKDDYPRFEITRRFLKDKSKYFGPYMAVNVKDILEIINSCYQLRRCKHISSAQSRECLNYHIGLCKAPCVKRVTKEEYAESVRRAIEFLNGNDDEAEEILKAKMQYFSENEDYELAISFRDKLKNLEIIREKRITAISRDINADIIAVSSDSIHTAISILFMRKGIMQGAKNFSTDAISNDTSEIISQFLTRYYKEGQELPDEIVIDNECQDAHLLEKYFKELCGKSVSIVSPKQGVRRQLCDMARGNADEYLEKTVGGIIHKNEMTKAACMRLKEILNLKRYPKRIECYDISNISGVDKVGSMVVFIDGEKQTSEYRRFMIKTVEGANDFASLEEVLRRRLGKLMTDEINRFPMPDLIVIDGGKGQLNAVKSVLNDYQLDIELISLAKREEEIFTVHSNQPVIIAKRDYVLKMLQRLRDEAHRFAITYFRNLHKRRMITSALDDIDGVGKQKKMALLKRFKSVKRISVASVDELQSVEGIGERLAYEIFNYFNNKSD